MRRTGSNPEKKEESSPRSHPTVQIVEVETVIDETDSTMTQSDTDKEMNDAVSSPLNKIIPTISNDEVEPLITSLWETVETLDIKSSESRTVLAEMFLDVISTISNLILDSFKNTVLEGRQRHPLLVSEEAVTQATQRSLTVSFTKVMGSTHISMGKLVYLLCSEVTSRINSVLCCSSLKGRRLRVAKDSEYTPPKDKLKAMVRYTQTMFRDSPKKRSLLPKLCPLCCSCLGEGTDSFSSSDTMSTETASPEQKSSSTGTSKQSILESPQIFTEEDEALMEEIVPSIERVHIQSGAVEEDKLSSSHHRAEKEMKKSTDSTNLCSLRSRQFSDSATKSPSISSLPSSSPSVQQINEDLMYILLNEAMALSNEDRSSLSEQGLETASSILSLIMDSRGSPISDLSSYDNSLTFASNKIKSFFALSYAKASFRRLLSRLCCQACVRPSVSLEEVMEDASPLLQELVQTEGDVYETMNNSICQRLELSDKLTDVIYGHLATTKDKPKFKGQIRIEVGKYFDQMFHWLHKQTQLPTLTDPVQRVLGRIRRLIFRMPTAPESTRRPLMITDSEEHHTLHTSQPLEPVLSREKYIDASEVALPPFIPLVKTTPAHIPVPTSPVPMQHDQTHPLSPSSVPTSRVDVALSSQWSPNDCNKLVCEVVSRIFQKKWRPDRSEMVAVSQDLQQKLEEQIPNWEILVKPSKHQYSKVADAVYKDLRGGTKKMYVTHAAMTQTSFSSEVVKNIRWHLEQPEKKPSLSSVLRSLWNDLWRH